MPQGKWQVKFTVVAIGYFTKWVEIEALAIITVAKIKHFIKEHIIYLFRLLNAIISNNGK